MQNVIVAIFKEESAAYEALSELKKWNSTSTLLAAGIVKNSNGQVVIKEGYNFEEVNNPNWLTDGLIGGLIGILAGPIGMLFGGVYGMAIGGLVDADDEDNYMGLALQVMKQLKNYHLALVCLADEADPEQLDAFFDQFHVENVIREDVISVQADIFQTEEVQKELAKKAKKKLKEEKKKEINDKAKETEAQLREKFEAVKKKLNL